MEFCDDCPCPKAGFAACPWRSGTHRHPHTLVCDRIRDGQTHWIDATIRRATRDAGVAIAPLTQPPPETRMQRHARITELIHECDYRGPVVRVRSGCQCEIRRCGLGRGSMPGKPDEVDTKDCTACVTGWKPAPAKVANTRTIDEHTFITTAQLTTDTIEFRKALPPDIDCIVGISRSGLLPGSLIAYDLHLPLYAVSRGAGVTDPGHGTRLEICGKDKDKDNARSPSHILLIDDTVASGTEMTACHPIVKARFPDAKVTRAVIYARPSAIHAVDMFYASYDGYHYLQWNFANAGFGSLGAWDFDGIISRDFTADECANDEIYRKTMATITPLYLPRRLPVPLIVTARPESTRDITLDWLNRHGVRVERLIMWPGNPHPPASEVAPWKAKHYAESDCMTFIESDPGQAQAIAELTGRPVLCPAAGKVFPGKPAETPKANASNGVNIRESLEIIHECDYRGPIIIPRCGCQGEFRLCGMNKGDARNPGQVGFRDCLECVKGA